MKNKFIKYFIVSWVVFILLSIFSFSTQRLLFFLGGVDFGADFFNVNRYVADFDPYGNTLNGPTEHGGMPLGYLYHYIFSLTADYNSLSLADCWHNVWGCLLPFALFSIFNYILFAFSLKEVANRYNVEKKWIIPVLMSSVVLFTLERGNSILMTAALINLFIVYFDSADKTKWWFAIIALAIVSVFKLVPGILCLLYLKNKDYKGFIVYGLVAAVLAFLPFLCFDGGFNNIPLVFERMSLQVKTYGDNFSPYRYGFMAVATQFNKVVPNPVWAILAKCVTYFLFLSSIVLVFIIKDKNKSVLYLMFIPALFAGSANVYNDLYLFPLFIYVLSDIYCKNKTNFILVLYFVMMQPIQIVYAQQSLSYILANYCSVLLWAYFVVDGFFEYKTGKSLFEK